MSRLIPDQGSRPRSLHLLRTRVRSFRSSLRSCWLRPAFLIGPLVIAYLERDMDNSFICWFLGFRFACTAWLFLPTRTLPLFSLQSDIRCGSAASIAHTTSVPSRTMSIQMSSEVRMVCVSPAQVGMLIWTCCRFSNFPAACRALATRSQQL